MAYNFASGSSQHLSTTTTPVTNAPCTFACWFRVASLPLGGSHGTLLCVSHYNNTGHAYILSLRGANESNRIGAGVFDGGYSQSTSASAPSINTWSHAAGVFSTTSNRIAYLNGTAGTANTVSRPNAASINSIGIGAVNRPTSVEYFIGLSADVGIWNVALTAAEIASLAKGMACDKVRPQSLVFYAPLARDLIDVRGGRTITNNNTATVANHTRIYQ
jgi:hypothetical protein